MPFNAIEEILADLRAGRMVVIVDDESRENEGDLLMVAAMVRPEDINFMASKGRGLICLTLTRERCRQLNLPLMVDRQGDSYGTNFTVSIEAATGVTTGISAYDRAHTIRTAVAPNATPADIVRPGHIFPLMARPGGVLTRAGHTEAGCDLARLAGFEPAAVIVEVLKEDGSMARRPDLEAFAAAYGLKIGTIEDLIRYRIQHERTVSREAELDIETAFGRFRLLAYQDRIDGGLHLALCHGDVATGQPVPVRVHLEDSLCDLLALRTGGCGWPLRDALQRIQAQSSGVAVILRLPSEPSSLLRRIRRMQYGGELVDTDADEEIGDLRTYGIGAQILADLGVRRMRLMSAPKRFHALKGFGLEVVDYIEGELMR